jgi:hypothetical protein
MINNLIDGFLAFKNIISFSALSKNKRIIVFYSEGANYYPHLKILLKTVLEKTNLNVCYVSSSRDDPGLAITNPKLSCFFIGFGFVRNYFFENIDAQLIVLTMPDLGNFQIKRSKFNVHYAYTQHSLVSSHMIYRNKAFDNYDSILCAGPHHIDEIKKAEKIYNLNQKNLVKFGYPRLDQLLNRDSINAKVTKINSNNKNELLILIAPSWGPEGVIESGLCLKLVQELLELGHSVVVRPHPQTINLNNEKVIEIKNTFLVSNRVTLEVDVQGYESLLSSDIMISDWSGVALEFAFGFRKPVIFCDVPKKINNPSYLDLELEPIENHIRDKIGSIWDTKSPIHQVINKCKNNINNEKLELLSNKYVYNIQKTDEAFIGFLESLNLI